MAGVTGARRMPASWRRHLAMASLWTIGCWLLFRPARQQLAGLVEGPQAPGPWAGRGLLRAAGEPGTGGLELAIDRSPRLSEAALASRAQPSMPNLPILYWQEQKGRKGKSNSSCASFPSLFDIHFNNQYWQEVETTNGTFHLYGAYLDLRAGSRLGPALRVLGMINRLEPTVKTHCQMWYPGVAEPVVSKVLEYRYIWYKKWGNYKQGLFQPYLLTCQLPRTHWGEVPASVSIVERRCAAATSNLRVVYNRREKGEVKKKFAVCVKGLDFPYDDLSVRLVEWIELLTALGADKIFFYDLEVHPNVTKVLEHYTAEGRVDVTPISLPGHQPNLPVLQHMYLKTKLNNKRQNELIPYNDCLYRNIYRYEYIALLDIDEVIAPLRHDSWAAMMEEVVALSLKSRKAPRASWNFRNVYFMEGMRRGPEAEVPPYLHMLQHVYRSANYTKPGQFVKCFHNTERALILHNHFALGCLGGACTSYPVDTALGHLQHYRTDCVNTLRKVCDEYRASSVRDTTVWRWRDQVVGRSTPVLQKLGFLARPES